MKFPFVLRPFNSKDWEKKESEIDFQLLEAASTYWNEPIRKTKKREQKKTEDEEISKRKENHRIDY